MITPRRTRLVRVADLQTFRRVVSRLALDGDPGVRVVVVPTRAAARQLARTKSDGRWPDLVTRDQLYDSLQARLSDVPSRLTPFAREAAIRGAAGRAAARGAEPPFALRPGLVAEVVRFYDQLRRQRQSVDRFEELLVDSIAGNPDDRGADQLLRQTRFLAATYREYEARLAALGAVDEHGLRERLIAVRAAKPVRHVIVAVGDWIADPNGLFPADFDLLTRLPDLEAVDVVATTGTLASGLHQRIHDWLPGLAEADAAALGALDPVERPVLCVPDGPALPLAFVRRDREEELAAVARYAKTAPDGRSTAVVFARPLPYVYLAPEVFESASVPYESHDALPLAAEPFAAACDLVVEFVLGAFSRTTGVALLRSPHFDWAKADRVVTRQGIAALDRLLSESRYLGDLERLRSLPDVWAADTGGERLIRDAAPAFAAMREAAEALAPLLAPAPMSAQVKRLAAFLDEYAARSDARADRARAAVAGLLDALAAAYAAHGDPESTIDGLATELRRWIEDETFVPDTGVGGLQLVDACAARFADVSTLFVVGLIEGEWPERARRNIFYPPGLLAALGWPSEADRRGADLAAFVDLLRSPRHATMLSTFMLDDEAIVEPAAILEEARNAGLDMRTWPEGGADRVFDHELLSLDPPMPARLGGLPAEWAAMRLERTAASDPRFHGEAGPREPRPVSVSAVETYLTCPFKYFARYVLKLDEEPEDEEVMHPKRQGQFVHAVFEAFFRQWDAERGGAITPDRLEAAHELFGRIAESHLSDLPEAEAALERTRLLGSAAAPGLAEAVFRMEAERPVPVVRRELEYPLTGSFTFDTTQGRRTIPLRGVADRIDLLEDGTFRLIDYKLGRAPNRARALQLPIYALCAEQRLEGRWTLGEAAYIAFREPKRVVSLDSSRSSRAEVLAAAADRLVSAVDAIAAGHFPPAPEDVFLCTFCGFGAVCRTDYVRES